ncbi:MAG: hypothetical protein Kow0047_16650 [Anaerolineae bacterium]
MLAVGEHWWGEVSPDLVRMAAAFGGGLGGTRQELCGALSGGVMALGYVMGPEHPGANEERLRALIRRYREAFEAEIGPTQCAQLRAELYGPDRPQPCSALVQKAVRILLRLAEEAGVP